MRFSLRLSVLTSFTTMALSGQPGNISTIVGDVALGDGGLATQAALYFPSQLALDRDGNLYFLDSRGYRIRKVTSNGRIETVAGTGFWPFVTGQTSVVATRSVSSAVEATALAVTRDGAVIFATLDLYCPSGAQRSYVMALTRSGELARLAGGGCGSITSDAPAHSAPLGKIDAIAAGAGGELYLAERETARILQLDGGTVRIFAGNAFRRISALAAGPDGTVFAADPEAGRIWRISPAGAVALAAEMAGVRDIAVGPSGEVFASALGPVFRLTAAGQLEPFVSGLHIDFTVDSFGRVYSHGDSSQIWRHQGRDAVDLVAGRPVLPEETRTPASARVLFLHRMRFGPGGDLWFWDMVGLRRLRPDGLLEAPLPRASPVFAVDERGLYFVLDGAIEHLDPLGVRSVYLESAALQGRLPEYLLAAGGKLYFSVPSSNEVYVVDGPGQLRLLAGAGALDNPRDLAADLAGNLYVSTRRLLVKIAPSGRISTVLGSAACFTARPEPGGGAEGLCFANQAIDADRTGNLFVTVRHFEPDKYGSYRSELFRLAADSGRVEPLLSGETGLSGDGGPSLAARQTGIEQIAVHPSGSVYLIADERIRRIAAERPFSVSPEGLRIVPGAPASSVSLAAGPGAVRPFRVRVLYRGSAAGWLSVTPEEGRLVPGETTHLRIAANAAGMSAGTYYALIEVMDTASGELIQIPVGFGPLSPRL